jgi:hypothetical protein
MIKKADPNKRLKVCFFCRNFSCFGGSVAITVLREPPEFANAKRRINDKHEIETVRINV